MKPKFIFQKIKNLFWHLPKSVFWNIYYQFPSKKLILIGITGTDGKTTTTNLIYHIFKNAGFNTGLISTLGCVIGDEKINTGLHTTSPDAGTVQKLLKKMVDSGVTHCILEVTAHSLDQYRFFGCNFEISAITNITHEHLDDFANLKDYALTKAKIFSMSKHTILNRDDNFYNDLKKINHQPTTTFSINSHSDFQAKKVKVTSNQLVFTVNNEVYKTNSNYCYQIYNILVALIVAIHFKLPSKLVQKTILHFPETKGRREEIKNDLNIRTIVDFAHTPAALKETLSSLKQQTKGKLLVIFGATGGRDKSKRPLMGQVVSQIADIAFVTSDDTRNENIEDINKQIISGMDKNFIYYNIPNRQDAFNQAIAIAKAGDTIIACGKGHETTILLGNTEYPWSEAEAYRTAIRNLQQ